MIARRQIVLAVSSSAGVEAMTLARQVAIAWLAGSAALGGFILLMIALRLVAMVTDLAGDRYLLASKSDRLQATLDTVHTYGMCRAVVCCVAFVLCCAFLPLAGDGLPMVLLITAIALKGLVHQGYRVDQRALRFGGLFFVELVPAVIATAALVPLLLVVDPALAIAVSLLLQQLCETISSWLNAGQHRFCPRVCKVETWRFSRFGFPLLLASMVLFFSMQGERLVLGLTLPADSFARLAVAVQLALIPALLAGRIMLTIGLPWMRTQSSADLARFLARITGPLFAFASFGVLAFAIVANPILTVLYGPGPNQTTALLAMIAAIQAGRVVRAPHSIAAQSQGVTRIPLIANIIRAASLAVMPVLLAMDMPLIWAFGPLLVGEALAFLYQVVALRRLLGRAHPTDPTFSNTTPMEIAR